MKIAALIPAYQPDEKLITLLEELSAKTDYFILVVNDGSREACNPIFETAKKSVPALSKRRAIFETEWPYALALTTEKILASV